MWEFTGTWRFLLQIDDSVVEQWKFFLRDGTKWDPERVTTHVAHRNVIFIRLSKSVLIVSVEDKPLLLSQISLEFELQEEIYEEVTPRSLIIVHDDTVVQYSLQNYKRPEYLKEF
jgi:hypothetical protein